MAIAACAVFSLAPSAQAQIVSAQRAGQGLPPGQVLAPSFPGGMVLVGSDIYVGDGVAGVRHFIASDQANPDPVDTGTLVYDTTDMHSDGGGANCAFLCQIAQLVFDGSTNVYAANPDQIKNLRGQSFAGVWRLTTPQPPLGIWPQGNLIAVNQGLAGNLPTAVALGPDGKLYVGFLRNGDIVRISNPQVVEPTSTFADQTQVVQKVGTAPNGHPVRALAFVGADLYIAGSDSFSVIQNATSAQCTGGCNAVPVADGFGGAERVGLATDGINRIYIAVTGRGVVRYSIRSNSVTAVSSGGLSPTSESPVPYTFVGGHTNLLVLDRLGNLWIGDDTSGGTANNAGRLWYISAAQLATLPTFP